MEAVITECKRVRSAKCGMSIEELTALVTACTAALSSPDAAAALCEVVVSLCRTDNDHYKANKEVCGPAGVIPAVAAAMSTHGATHALVAYRGCEALSCLAHWPVYADALVLSTGGLDAILSVVASHPDDEDVLQEACEALFFIASSCGPGAKRVLCEKGVLEVARAAQANPINNEDIWTRSQYIIDILSSVA